jgi:hypothetical protein
MVRRATLIGTKEADAVSVELRVQARAAGSAAMAELVRLALCADSESVQLAAIKELLDRGFGRAAQGDQAGAVIAHLLVDDGYAH